MTHRLAPDRVLAIDPTNKGFGFAVFEGPSRLIDWGVRRAMATNRDAAAVAAVVQLMKWYEPSTLTVEDCRCCSARRRERVQQLSQDLIALAGRAGLRCVCVPWIDVRIAVGESPIATKEQIAARLVATFPELARHLPPHRKPWMSPDARLCIFTAVALALRASSRR